MHGRRRVAALDLTFSASKSVSVLFAVGDREMSVALVEAHERAVGEALAYVEREACSRAGGGTAPAGCAATCSSPPLIGIGCRGRAIRSCIRMWWWRI